MRTNSAAVSRIVFGVACATLVAGAAAVAVADGGADRDAITQAVMERATRDAELRGEYTFKERTEVTVDDEIKLTRLELHRVDRDGVPQVTVLSEDRPEPRRNRGVQARVMAYRAEKLDQRIAAVNAFLGPYALGSAGAMLDFVNAAVLQPGDQAGTSKLRAVDVVHPGDVVTLLIEDATGRILRRSIRTTHDGDEVGVTVECDALDDTGLGYPARSTISLPADQTRIVIERFDHTRQ